MIAPKIERPTAADEARAYSAATRRDNDSCVRCLRGGDVQRDHRQNRSQGGLTVVENLQLLCLTCHTWKGDHPDDANRDGWGVPGIWAHWLSYPARRWVKTEVGTYRLAWGLYRDIVFVEISEREAADRRAGLRQDVPELVS